MNATEFAAEADQVFAALQIARADLGVTYAAQFNELAARLSRLSDPAARRSVPLCNRLAAAARTLGI